MSQALSNLSISFPLYSSNKASNFCHLPFLKLPQNLTQNRCFSCKNNIKAMAGESRDNLDHLQRANRHHHSQPNKKRVGPVAPIGLWDKFPKARTVQQMMEKMERMMEDPFAYSGTWPSPLLNDVKVWVEEKMLVVKAEKVPKKKINGQESGKEEEEWSAKSYGRYSSRIAMPENVLFEKIRAEVKDGVLYITIPKASSNSRILDIHVQ
ncbi:hypothetical protein CRYUN_Cryun06bG0131400 [Craigia yunnanensis]